MSAGKPGGGAVRPSHMDEAGRLRMVDISGKPATRREATARAVLSMRSSTRDALVGGGLSKGDALTAARLAGIQAAKRASELIPLCHGLPLSHVEVAFDLQDAAPPPGLEGSGLRLRATCRTMASTGVEMEALVAVSVAALTLYDFCKSVERSVRIHEISLLEKKGGKSGHYKAK